MLALLDKVGRLLATLFLVLFAISAVRLIFVGDDKLDETFAECLFLFGLTFSSVGLADLSKVNSSKARMLASFSLFVGFVALVVSAYLFLLGESLIATALAVVSLGCFGMARSLWEVAY